MIEVELERVAHGGVVVGRFDGKVIFVTGGLPGERVVVEITEKGSRFDRGRVIRVLEASPGRVEPPCPIAGECGGCDWQHASPELQLDLKTAVVAEQLSRLAGITWPGRVEAIQPTVNWRTRMRYSVSGGRVGLRGRRSHEVVPLPETGCLAAAPGLFPAQLNELAEGAESLSVVRAANRVSVLADGKLLIGPPRVREKAGKFSFQVAASGFWQVHPRAAETLLDAVMEGLKPRQGDLALDLYCGSGLFAAGLDHSGAEVFGVELDREAAANARVTCPGRFWRCRWRRHCDGSLPRSIWSSSTHPGGERGPPWWRAWRISRPGPSPTSLATRRAWPGTWRVLRYADMRRTGSVPSTCFR